MNVAKHPGRSPRQASSDFFGQRGKDEVWRSFLRSVTGLGRKRVVGSGKHEPHAGSSEITFNILPN